MKVYFLVRSRAEVYPVKGDEEVVNKKRRTLAEDELAAERAVFSTCMTIHNMVVGILTVLLHSEIELMRIIF